MFPFSYCTRYGLAIKGSSLVSKLRFWFPKVKVWSTSGPHKLLLQGMTYNLRSHSCQASFNIILSREFQIWCMFSNSIQVWFMCLFHAVFIQFSRNHQVSLKVNQDSSIWYPSGHQWTFGCKKRARNHKLAHVWLT